MSGERVISIGALTDKGQVRELNEDSIGTPERMRISDELLANKGELLAVADGMGGHAAGEVASQEAIHTLYAKYYDDPSADLPRSLRRAVEQANAHILAQAASDLGKQGMGTTLVAAVIRGRRLIVANVGDSRAYLFRDGSLRQVSRDHSWVAEALSAGLITEEQAKNHAYRNLITRALGQKPDVEVDLNQERLRAGDLLLLCSDGLTNEVDDARIAQVLSQGSPVETTRSLVILANRGGGRDNISAVVARVPSGRERLRAGSAPALALSILILLAAVGLAFALWSLVLRGGGGKAGVEQGQVAVAATTTEVLPTPGRQEATLPTSLPTLTRTLAPEPTTAQSPTDMVAPEDSATTPPSPTALPQPSVTSVPSASALPQPRAVPRSEGPGQPVARYREQTVPLLAGAPPLRCLSGRAHSFTAAGESSPGAFLLRLDGKDYAVGVPPHDSSRQCLPWLPTGTEVTVCEDPAADFPEGHHDRTTVIVLWPQGEEPILWLLPPEGKDLHKLSEKRPVVDELLKLTNWEKELKDWMQERGLAVSPEFLNEPILVYSRWGQQGDECRLLLELVSMEGGESGVFFSDGRDYLHYTAWGP